MANKYRKNVAAIIINKEKKVLMCEHIWIDGAWQLPQGGLEDGEKDEVAILRELNEELGSKNFKILGKLENPINYQFPFYLREKYGFNGNAQTFFLIYFSGKDSEIRFDNQEKPEFKAFKWVEFNMPPIMVIYFKKLAYLEAINKFENQVKELKEDFWKEL